MVDNILRVMKMKLNVYLFCLILVVVVDARFTEQIIGGHDAERGILPNLASVQVCRYNRTRCKVFCSGAILHKYWILTAAHCLTHLAKTIELNGELIVSAGKWNINKWDPFQQVSAIKDMFKYPSFEILEYFNVDDIGLIKLLEGFMFQDFIKPYPLSYKKEDPNGTALIAGWGAVTDDLTRVYPDILQSLTVEMINRELCRALFKFKLEKEEEKFYDSYITDNNICTGPVTGGKAACQGDSGGPLMKKNVFGEYEVIGVIMFGVRPCGCVGGPTIYSKVSRYIGWIEHMMENK